MGFIIEFRSLQKRFCFEIFFLLFFARCPFRFVSICSDNHNSQLTCLSTADKFCFSFGIETKRDRVASFIVEKDTLISFLWMIILFFKVFDVK